MTKYDIRNYLEKIYNLDVALITTRIALGKTRKEPVQGYIIKEDDIKYAYVTLVRSFFVMRRVLIALLQPKEQKFEFPDLYPAKKESELKAEEKQTMKAAKQQHKALAERMKDKPGLPAWFLK